MSEPWRIAIAGPEFFPDSNRRVYSRLRTLKRDWPKATFHAITAATAGVAASGLRAAKALGWSYTAVGDGAPWPEYDRLIAWWDFECPRTRALIKDALERGIHTEVWDRENEPAGPAAADEVLG